MPKSAHASGTPRSKPQASLSVICRAGASPAPSASPTRATATEGGLLRYRKGCSRRARPTNGTGQSPSLQTAGGAPALQKRKPRRRLLSAAVLSEIPVVGASGSSLPVICRAGASPALFASPTGRRLQKRIAQIQEGMAGGAPALQNENRGEGCSPPRPCRKFPLWELPGARCL